MDEKLEKYFEDTKQKLSCKIRTGYVFSKPCIVEKIYFDGCRAQAEADRDVIEYSDRDADLMALLKAAEIKE